MPVIHVVNALPVSEAAAREAHELRMQGGDDLRQVFAQAVLTVTECLLGEE